MTEFHGDTSRAGTYPPGTIDSSASGYQQPPGLAPAIDPAQAPQILIDEADSGTTAVFIASFAEFYDVHHAKIARALALNFGDAELGREATDEAMTRAYARWGTVSGHNNPAGWVYRVGLNWGRSWYRRAGRRLPWFDRSSTELPETSDPALRQALLALDDKHRAVVVCRYFMDWSTNQTAAALDLPTGTVKSRLHHALTELRLQLEPDDDQTTPHPQEGQSHGF